jgi:hypothetical protein
LGVVVQPGLRTAMRGTLHNPRFHLTGPQRLSTAGYLLERLLAAASASPRSSDCAWDSIVGLGFLAQSEEVPLAPQVAVRFS